MKKLLFTLGFVSLLNATPSPITTEEIAHLKSTEVIADDAGFDQAVFEMWSDNFIRDIYESIRITKEFYSKTVSELQCKITEKLALAQETSDKDVIINKIMDAFFSETSRELPLKYSDILLYDKDERTVLNEIYSTFLYGSILSHNITNIEEKIENVKNMLNITNVKRPISEIDSFSLMCMKEYENYNQQDVNECSFHGNEENLFKYHAIFNQTSDHLGADGKIPNFIAFFSLTYLFEEFKRELDKINWGNPENTHPIFGDIYATFKDEDIIQKILTKDSNLNDDQRYNILQSCISNNNICDFTQYHIMKIFKFEEYNFSKIPTMSLSSFKQYPILIMEKLASMFLKSLNINYINTDGFSPEFIEFAAKFIDFPILIKALSK